MAPTFGSLDPASVTLTLATGSFTQLFRTAAFPTAGVTDVSGNAFTQFFEKGQAITIKRPRLAAPAIDFDPRGGVDAASSEPGYVIQSLILEKLFTSGFPIYSMDASPETYFLDYSMSTGGAIRKSADDYLYATGFRTFNLASTGPVRLNRIPPIATVWSENSTGVIQPFSDSLLINAGTVLNQAEVPAENRVARLSSTAAGSFLGDITLVSQFAGALSPGAGNTANMVATGFSFTQDYERRGFMVRGANAVTGQSQVLDLGGGTPTTPFAAPVQDVALFVGDDDGLPVGAVQIPLTVAGALNPGIAVGKIARIGPDAGVALAYGVILRVDTNQKAVWLVPYASNGVALPAAALTGGKFGIPAIGSVNTANHKEALAWVSRLLTEPTPGSGAIAQRVFDNQSGLAMQVFRGSYNVHRFSEGIRSAILMGAMPTDHRKGVLMLSV